MFTDERTAPCHNTTFFSKRVYKKEYSQFNPTMRQDLGQHFSYFDRQFALCSLVQFLVHLSAVLLYVVPH